MDQTDEQKCLNNEISLLNERAKITVEELKELHAEHVKAVEAYFYGFFATSSVMTTSLFNEKHFNHFGRYEKSGPLNLDKDLKGSLVRILKFSDEIDLHAKRFRDFNKSLWVIYEEKKKEMKEEK